MIGAIPPPPSIFSVIISDSSVTKSKYPKLVPAPSPIVVSNVSDIKSEYPKSTLSSILSGISFLIGGGPGTIILGIGGPTLSPNWNISYV